MDSLRMCETYCAEFQFMQYQTDTECLCFSACDFARPAGDYEGSAVVYERPAGVVPPPGVRE